MRWKVVKIEEIPLKIQNTYNNTTPIAYWFKSDSQAKIDWQCFYSRSFKLINKLCIIFFTCIRIFYVVFAAAVVNHIYWSNWMPYCLVWLKKFAIITIQRINSNYVLKKINWLQQLDILWLIFFFFQHYDWNYGRHKIKVDSLFTTLIRNYIQFAWLKAFFLI